MGWFNKNGCQKRTYTHCGVTFTKIVGKTSGMNGGKRATVSDQVKCPKCSMFVPTWGGKKS